MIHYSKDALFKSRNKNIYACLVNQEDLENKNFGLRTPIIEIQNKKEIIDLIKKKYKNFDKGFLFLIKQLERYLGIKYNNIYKAKYRYLQIFKKNKINIVFLRVISLSLINNSKENINFFNKSLINDKCLKIEKLKLKVDYLNKRVSYLIGVIAGDGSLNKKDNNLSITDGQADQYKLELSKNYLLFIGNLFKKEFDIQGKIYRKKENCWTYILNNKWLCRFINYYLEIPYGKKCNIIKLPKLLSGLNEKYFWRGLMDTDGFVREKRKQISFKTNSLVLINQFKDFCQRNDIITSVRKEKAGYTLRVLTNSFLNYAKLIGFSHPRKKEILLSHLKEGPKYKILKNCPNKNYYLYKFLKPYKDMVYISFSDYNQKTDKEVVKKIMNDISKTFNVKITTVKRNRYNNQYVICSKKFTEFIKINTNYKLPWQPLNIEQSDNLSKKWEL